MKQADLEMLRSIHAEKGSTIRQELSNAIIEIAALREENAKLKSEISEWQTNEDELLAYLRQHAARADALRDVLESAPPATEVDFPDADGIEHTGYTVDEEAYAAWFHGPRKEALK